MQKDGASLLTNAERSNQRDGKRSLELQNSAGRREMGLIYSSGLTNMKISSQSRRRIVYW